ncbi:MAG: VWA domain-containing protein [Prosthecobacter sp.]|uniref:vWA domain-containing protein n=1 Tax=Prosthecobacter sp. TaxID=1965333 RepID=UPI0025F5B6C1|nr:vWA domain-containing protein [Prosthecobacter sp.]MCF7788178.1 VWA domain-containing protein [Prosthecobacter sp.]
MSWLFPIYLAGAAAIIAPILLHLRRRPPQDRVEFSSLLFLDASTPVPVSKRRLENWLLLLLRCLALILLALMFARPFMQSESATATSGDKATLILLDRSASMRRDDLWKRGVAEAERLFKEAKITDRIALAVFDGELTPVWTFEEDRNTPANRVVALQSRLAELAPSWGGTQLDRALIAAVPSFDASTAKLKKRIHLITDLQEGTHLDALRTIAWPAELTLKVHRLDPVTNDNFSMALAARDEEGNADALIRIRLSNTRDSALRDFTLAWEKGPQTDSITAQIPPGASRILNAPPNSTNATTLNLSGDKYDFDNRLFIAPPQPRAVRIHFLGDEATRDEAAAPLYYLARALQPTATLAPVLTAGKALPVQKPDLLVISGSTPAVGMHASLRDFVSAGGFLVQVATSKADAALLQTLTGIPGITIKEGDANDDYRMLADVKVEHPLLRPFADPKLRDFTKLRFWKHRDIEIKDATNKLETLANFDNGQPAIVSARIGKGTLIVLASGWHPGDSQLALSTKFVPLLYGWLAAAGFSHDPAATLLVGEDLPLDALSEHTITDPENKTHSLKAGEAFTATQIGLYKVQSASHTQILAVNLSPDEGRVLPLAPEKLAEYGIKISSGADSAAGSESTDERLTATDTEQRQQSWWYILLMLLAVLLLETWFAGRTRQTALQTA